MPCEKLEFAKCKLEHPWTFQHVDDVVELMQRQRYSPLVTFRDGKGGLIILFRRELEQESKESKEEMHENDQKGS
jgi:hypothetical protein